ncbi:MAG: restriction endonuclease [Cyanobacteriota bacterium]|nr:restriction endonuclease [Cyanobacteriota bacterium]
MKVVETIDVICRGHVDRLSAWRQACSDVDRAVISIDWPHNTGIFKLNPGRQRNANGVKPIKLPGIRKLEEFGWQTEHLPTKLSGVKMGNLDAILESEEGLVGFEWETGNISSSHRAVNKILLAILKGGLLGGILVVPSEAMRPYLTDRIGNITELRAYFPLWSAVRFEFGVFRVVVVEYDCLDSNVPLIPKGRDGMAFR